MNDNSGIRPFSRRDFLKTGLLSAGALALPSIVPSIVFGQNAPSKQITIGIVGIGGIAQGHLKSLLGEKSCRILAVCDVDTTRVGKALQMVNTAYGNTDCKAYGDFRELNQRKDIDAVFVTTPDHWHVLVAIDAVRNGKHIYVEKPLSLTLREGQALVAATRKYKKVGQTGTQQRSSVYFRKVAELIRNERLGKLKRVDIRIPANNKYCTSTWTADKIPEGLDWNFWLGPAAEKPFNHQGCHYNFRYIRDYARGQITNWGTHYVDIVQWALDMDASGPVAVDGFGVYPSSGLFSNATYVDTTVTYANGVPLRILTRNDGIYDGDVRFEGENGWILASRSQVTSSDPEIMKDPLPESAKHLLVSKDHHLNFLGAIRGETQAVSDVACGHRTNTVCIISDISMRLRRKLQWDPVKEEFVNDEVANRLLGQAMRSPWSLV